MEEEADNLITVPDHKEAIPSSSSNDSPQPRPFDSSLFDQPSQELSETINFVGSEVSGADNQLGDKVVAQSDLGEGGIHQAVDLNPLRIDPEIKIEDGTADYQRTKVTINEPREEEDVSLVVEELEKSSINEPGETCGKEVQDETVTMESDSKSQQTASQSVLSNLDVKHPLADKKNTDTNVHPDKKPVDTSNLPSVTSFHKQNTPWEEDDPFQSAISNSETDRRQDAWLPCEATLKVLHARITMQGTDYTSRPDLTMPGISFDEAQMDPLKELSYKYHGDEEAAKRKKLTLDQVTRDLDGLKRLLNDGCLRSALQLTGLLLTSVGQGKGQAGMPSQNTSESLQIWFTRLALLAKLRQFSTAELESQPFKDFDKPDMYYQYYPALYPGRKGSMVPFSLRLLVAEIPQFVSQHQESMTRLYAVLSTCQKIVANLSQGFDEYGDRSGVSDEYIKASLILWTSRVNRVQFSIGNCLLAMKDYYQSINVFQALSKIDSSNCIKIQSLVGRVYLQLGDLKSAQEVFSGIEKFVKMEDDSAKIQILMNRGFLRMAQNMYTDAHIQFSEVVKLDPANFTAINNISVCLLYMGKLKSALNLLESLVNGDPAKYLDESILFNLCTLYELESSKSGSKKQSLLGMAAKHKGDGFNTSCLKLT